MWFFAGFVALMLLALLLRMLDSQPQKNPDLGNSALPYQREQYLLTGHEKAFFDLLITAAPSDVYVCPQVGLSAILKVRPGSKKRTSYQNRIHQKRIDYLICDKASLRSLVVVELDDSSHDSPKRQDRDTFLDDACKSAGLKILHFRGRQAFDPAKLQQTLHSAVSEARS